jgi:hypothetical protein
MQMQSNIAINNVIDNLILYYNIEINGQHSKILPRLQFNFYI